MWDVLLTYRLSGFLLGCGSPTRADDSEENTSALGIVQSHAYSLLDLKEVDGHKLLQLRNPWGRKEWQGDWADNSPLWTRRLKAKVSYKNKEDGTFWMNYQDFTLNFNEVYVCRFFHPSTWPSQGSVQGVWRKGETAGGGVRYQTVETNMQWRLLPLQPGPVTLVLELTQSPLPLEIEAHKSKDTGTDNQTVVAFFPTALHLIVLEVYDNAGLLITK